MTQFYLCVAGGGALGGAVVGLGAPIILPGYFEVEIGARAGDARGAVAIIAAQPRMGAAGASVMLGAAATATYRIDDATTHVVAMSRNFYGVLRVREFGSANDPGTLERRLVHGSIMHGQQYLDDDLRRLPTSYYTPTSGIGRLLRARDDRPLQVGMVGLGAGTIAAYGRPGDSYTFFEIDTAVAEMAREYFSFLADSPATIHVLFGDGRLLLQRDSAATRFDVLAVDAFSGDSIPVHLLTREAVSLYLSAHARRRDRAARQQQLPRPASSRRPHRHRTGPANRVHRGSALRRRRPREGVVRLDPVARDRAILDRPAIREGARALPASPPGRAWTDDYSNIVQVMSWTKALSR